MYHLPLLPGYGPNSNIRSSVPTSSDSEEPPIPVSEAEDSGYITSLPAQADVYTPDLDIHISESASENKLGKRKADEFAEVVFFSYGVVVFFGLEEEQESTLR